MCMCVQFLYIRFFSFITSVSCCLHNHMILFINEKRRPTDQVNSIWYYYYVCGIHTHSTFIVVGSKIAKLTYYIGIIFSIMFQR